MHNVTPDAVVIGVDTHKDVHVVAAINGLGARLATACFPGNPRGLSPNGILGGRAQCLACVWPRDPLLRCWPDAGPNCHGLASHRSRPGPRQLGRRYGKADTVAAQFAARAVLAGDADSEPKFGDGILIRKKEGRTDFTNGAPSRGRGSMPRSNNKSSTFRSESGSRTYSKDHHPDHLRQRVKISERVCWLAKSRHCPALPPFA